MEKQFCTRCNKELNPKNIVWLELSNTDGRYYNTIPTGHRSQGCFPFGPDCAPKELKQQKQ